MPYCPEMSEFDGALAAKRLLDLVEELRAEEFHVSQSELASKLGISQPYLSRLIRRDRDVVGAQIVARVASALGISRDYFQASPGKAVSYRDFLRAPDPDSSWTPSDASAERFLKAYAEGRVSNRVDFHGPRLSALIAQTIDASLSGEKIDPDTAVQIAKMVLDQDMHATARLCLRMRDIKPEFCSELGHAIVGKLESSFTFMAEDDAPADD